MDRAAQSSDLPAVCELGGSRCVPQDARSFRRKIQCLMRPNGDPALPTTVAPGLHVLYDQIPRSSSQIISIWWDTRALRLGAEAPLGIRKSELIVKNVLPKIVADDLADYQSWRKSRDGAVASGARSIRVRTDRDGMGKDDSDRTCI